MGSGDNSLGDYGEPIKGSFVYYIYNSINNNYFFVMEIYLLTATEISRTNEIDVNTLAFMEYTDAVAEMKCKILDDLHNFNDYREMDIYEQEEFVERLLSGSSESLNGYDIIYDKTTLTYIRTYLFTNRMYQLFIEKTVVKM